ncbi:MAG: SCO family protein [Jatrophihabitans sp.]
MIRLLALLLAVAGLVAGCASSGGSAKNSASQLNGRPIGATYQGAGLTPAQPRPNFTLADTAGRSFAFGSTTAGHPTLLYFGYTHCPDVCPTTMIDTSIALKSLPAALQKKTYVVFVTTDVKGDSGPVLAKWLTNFTAGAQATFVGLTGTQAQIDAAQAGAHVTVAEDGGQTHSSELLLYGADNYARVAFLQSNTLQEQISHDLPLVAAKA